MPLGKLIRNFLFILLIISDIFTEINSLALEEKVYSSYFITKLSQKHVSTGTCVSFTNVTAIFELRSIYILKIAPTLIFRMITPIFNSIFEITGSRQSGKCTIYILLLIICLKKDHLHIKNYVNFDFSNDNPIFDSIFELTWSKHSEKGTIYMLLLNYSQSNK